MENKICPIKSGMEKKDVYCSSECGYFCEAGKDTKCAIAGLLKINKEAEELRRLFADRR